MRHLPSEKEHQIFAYFHGDSPFECLHPCLFEETVYYFRSGARQPEEYQQNSEGHHKEGQDMGSEPVLNLGEGILANHIAMQVETDYGERHKESHHPCNDDSQTKRHFTLLLMFPKLPLLCLSE
jgi:hypothetical protein